LQKEGFQIVIAGGGEEGLRRMRELRPDAVTLDVLMPGMDGWSVLTQMKADPELAAIPVIMVTIVDDKNMGYTLGAVDYLTKPISRERLLGALNRFIQPREERDVLVVEDDQVSRQLVCEMLQREGLATREAENGRVALQRLADRPPAAIVLDLMMPVMDGFEFVHEVRKHEAWRQIPVVVVTARDISQDDRERLQGFVEQILQKGIYKKDDLLSEVRELVAASIEGRARS
jgi:CheY-like chemotaxis protein